MMVCGQQAMITVVFHGVLTSERTDIQKVRSGKMLPLVSRRTFRISIHPMKSTCKEVLY